MICSAGAQVLISQSGNKTDNAMKRSVYQGLITIIAALAVNVSCTDRHVVLLPAPASGEWGRHYFEFTPSTVISVEDDSQKEIAEWFAWLFSSPAGFVPKVGIDMQDPDVILHADSRLPQEAYRIKVTRRNIRVEASSPSGFFYAFQTLRFTLPSAISSRRHADGVVWLVPAMDVEDAPVFSHRCLKLDVTEHYVPVESIIAFIDCMGMLKLNNLHVIMEFGDSYSREDHERIMDFAAENYVNVTPASGCIKNLYSFPDDIASKLFPDIAALAQVAWTGRDVTDIMYFNESVDRLEEHLRHKGIYVPDVVYNVAVADLR